ncbi:MAG: class I SAM-dependent methyltransferase [Candidatus Omnitrophota bacterium]|nr:MAG: class I SAM-dependent methyltransferase [Candidatus Omnitrophota bacterium]
MKATKEIWDNFWDKYKFSTKEDKSIIRQEAHSVRWKKIEKKIVNRHGSFKELDVAEIGSGRGEVSALMAQRGANVTLIDYSEVALGKAKELFNNIGVNANFLKADIRDIPKHLLNSFDVSMSFGLVEHFDYPLRRDMVKLHGDLLKPGGISFIAVPNTWCVPYRFFMKLSKMLGYCSEGFEVPFSRSELKKIAVSAGFGPYEIVGSSLIRDSVYFLFSRYISHLAKWKLIIDTSVFEIPSVFDDYLGYSLVLIGFKGGEIS